ncbi:trichohyalin-like [Scaptodrosophila lebanonensis]|uniref:Trichohyalin-like n=1 Tax=Drosophila lebanonensis TaxID=7225 RepID=A0A6J2UI62_DROLE|nr:trichohyalin-like [Scaptodrosophila lebanonensis]
MDADRGYGDLEEWRRLQKQMAFDRDPRNFQFRAPARARSPTPAGNRRRRRGHRGGRRARERRQRAQQARLEEQQREERLRLEEQQRDERLRRREQRQGERREDQQRHLRSALQSSARRNMDADRGYGDLEEWRRLQKQMAFDRDLRNFQFRAPARARSPTPAGNRRRRRGHRGGRRARERRQRVQQARLEEQQRERRQRAQQARLEEQRREERLRLEEQQRDERLRRREQRQGERREDQQRHLRSALQSSARRNMDADRGYGDLEEWRRLQKQMAFDRDLRNFQFRAPARARSPTPAGNRRRRRGHRGGRRARERRQRVQQARLEEQQRERRQRAQQARLEEQRREERLRLEEQQRDERLRRREQRQGERREDQQRHLRSALQSSARRNMDADRGYGDLEEWRRLQKQMAFDRDLRNFQFRAPARARSPTPAGNRRRRRGHRGGRRARERRQRVQQARLEEQQRERRQRAQQARLEEQRREERLRLEEQQRDERLRRREQRQGERREDQQRVRRAMRDVEARLAYARCLQELQWLHRGSRVDSRGSPGQYTDYISEGSGDEQAQVLQAECNGYLEQQQEPSVVCQPQHDNQDGVTTASHDLLEIIKNLQAEVNANKMLLLQFRTEAGKNMTRQAASHSNASNIQRDGIASNDDASNDTDYISEGSGDEQAQVLQAECSVYLEQQQEPSVVCQPQHDNQDGVTTASHDLLEIIKNLQAEVNANKMLLLQFRTEAGKNMTRQAASHSNASNIQRDGIASNDDASNDTDYISEGSGDEQAQVLQAECSVYLEQQQEPSVVCQPQHDNQDGVTTASHDLLEIIKNLQAEVNANKMLLLQFRTEAGKNMTRQAASHSNASNIQRDGIASNDDASNGKTTSEDGNSDRAADADTDNGNTHNVDVSSSLNTNEMEMQRAYP